MLHNIYSRIHTHMELHPITNLKIIAAQLSQHVSYEKVSEKILKYNNCRNVLT